MGTVVDDRMKLPKKICRASWMRKMMRNAERQHGKGSQRATAGIWLSAWLFCSLAAITGRAYAQIVIPGPYLINTVAGDGSAGYFGDGGLATSAELYNPTGVAVDSAGNIYIADYLNNRVREVMAATGDIATVAGNGTAGFSGDGGLATSAELNRPSGVAVDASGNIYIADYENNRIREVTAATGDIATVAGNGTAGYSGDGGLATNAELDMLVGLAVDSAGNIYIADTFNNRIRKVTAATAKISTVAGDGTAGYLGDGGLATSAELNYPLGVAVDASGNIYIADSENSRIRMVTKSTSDISTVAGNGTAGYLGDGGLATSAEIDYPLGVGLDTAGNIYIADTDNDRIRMVTKSTSDISTVAGNGTAGYLGDGGLATSAEIDLPEGVAVDSAGNIYIADTDNNRIRAVGGIPTITTLSPTSGPVGTLVTISGTDFGSPQGTSTVTFNGATATPQTWYGTQIVVPVPAAATTGPVIVTVDGVSSNSKTFTFLATPNILTLSPTTGPAGTVVTVTGTKFGSPQGSSTITFDGMTATPTSWTGTKIVVPVPAGSGTGPVVVVVKNVPSNGVTFTNTTTPIITSITPAFGNVGTSVTINGSLFGATQGASTVTFDGIATVPTYWNPDGGQIVAPAPAGATTGNVVVTVNSLASNAIQFAYNQVLLQQGIINTVAGNGTASYSGDGGLATYAEISQPHGVAVDTIGNIYIADEYNNRIRKVTGATGIISTVAGGGTGCTGQTDSVGDGCPATSAELNYPEGVAVDSAGNIYIADQQNSRIRKVTASTGIISTVAGNGTAGYSGDGGLATSAELGQSTGVAVDSAGNIYIADYLNSRIRKVTASTGIISTVAGNGTVGYSGDGGLATSAELDGPTSVAVDSAGNIYIADFDNSRIRKVTVSTSDISTVAGNGTAGYSGDGGLATSAELRNPWGVTVDASGNIYIADSGNSCIREVIVSTGGISTVAGNGTVGYSGDGGLSPSAELYSPDGLAVDSAGNIYIADTGNERIRAVGLEAAPVVLPPAGLISTVAGDGTARYSGDGGLAIIAELYQPQAVSADSTYNSGVAVDSAGNIYISDSSNNRIRKVAVSNGIISTVAGDGTAGYSGDGGLATSAELRYPWGVTVDASGNIYIVDTNNSRIRKVTASTGIISTVAGDGTYGYSGDGGAATSAELYYPKGVAADSAGNIYFADGYRIRKVTASTGVISTVAGDGTYGYSGDGGPATSAELFVPDGVAVDSAGNIYIADANNNRIRKVTASTGIISTVAGDGAAGYSGDGGAATSAELYEPTGVAVDSAGNLYISDATNNRIRKVTASAGIISTVAGDGTAGYSGDGGAATSAELAGPESVTVDSSGNIYFADSTNERIRAVGQ